ncbi:hypothetical protein GGR57DRAFT_182085 [Xylariaceae sp. FL1272]|nr:hypothetical protein GGR57DRAFT_182085 [Xylariaceae sp. FL1272]
MAPGTAQQPASPDVASFQRTAKVQLGSTFFSRLPLEIREMIYAECCVASGPKQHVFLSPHDGRLTHSPCLLEPGDHDERNDEIQRLMSRQGQNRRGSRCRSSLVVDGQWASRFASAWHEHWRCEEAMLQNSSDNEHRRRPQTLFLSLLLLCKQTYVESFKRLYTSTTLVFTDLEAAHRCLFSTSSKIATSLLRSLDFSLALSYHTLHEQRMHDTPSQCNGPWAQLCTKLSDLARFASLRTVTIRLDLMSETGDDDAGDWWRVHERWALCAIRGILARRLTVYLPNVAHPEWSRKYQYVEGDATPFRLERYQKMRWVSVGDGRHVESLVDLPTRTSSDGRSRESSTTRFRKARRGLRDMVVSVLAAH